MARPLRIEFPGAVYHLTGRGNDRAPIFLDDSDRAEFLGIVADLVERYNWLCHGYCLMDNHYHLLVETPDGNLVTGMRQLGGIYTQRFNRLHNRSGHLFQGRYKSIVVDKESYLQELCRYIVLNPFRAKIVTDPGDYSWSSYRATVGIIRPPHFLHVNWLLAQFGRDRTRARHLYREFVAAGIGEQSPWNNLKGQCLLGGSQFLKKLSPHLQARKGQREIPRRARFVDRPSLSRLFSSDQAKTDRNRMINQAHVQHGYSQQEIASHIGLHYSTVSRIVARERSGTKHET